MNDYTRLFRLDGRRAVVVGAGSGIGRYVQCLHDALCEHAGELGLRLKPITEPHVARTKISSIP